MQIQIYKDIMFFRILSLLFFVDFYKTFGKKDFSVKRNLNNEYDIMYMIRTFVSEEQFFQFQSQSTIFCCHVGIVHMAQPVQQQANSIISFRNMCQHYVNIVQSFSNTINRRCLLDRYDCYLSKKHFFLTVLPKLRTIFT